MRQEKPPLKLHYRLNLLPVYRKLEWTLAYRSCGTKERERAREGSLCIFFLRSLAGEFKKKSPKSEVLSKTEKTLWKIINGLEKTLSSVSGVQRSKVKSTTIIKCKLQVLLLQVRPLYTDFFIDPIKAKTCLVPPHPSSLRKQPTIRDTTLVFPVIDVWGTSSKIPYWWRLGSASIGRATREICFNQSKALPRFWCWHVISMEFLQSFHRHHFAGKPVLASAVF